MCQLVLTTVDLDNHYKQHLPYSTYLGKKPVDSMIEMQLIPSVNVIFISV